MSLRALRFAALALTLMGVAGGARAQDGQGAPGEVVTEIDPIDVPPEHDPLAHAWERQSDRGGFYLRVSSLLGVHDTRLGPAPWDSGYGLNAHGFGSGFGLDIGAFVSPWVALHLDSTVGILWNGDVDFENDIVGSSSERSRIVAYGFAPAATFYAPRAFFFKTAFGVGLAHVKRRNHAANTTDPGFYMNLVAGKDLYVDRHFAVGLQLQITYMLLSDEQRADEARVRQYLFGFSGAFDSH